MDVIENLCCVTAFATLSESSQMHIIILMTLVAGTRQIHLAIDRPAVAGIAVSFFMRAIKFEIGLLVMIETPYLP